MEEPYYVLKTNERVMIPQNDTIALYYLKKILWIIYAIVIIWSIAEQEFILWEVSKAACISLAIATIAVSGMSKRENKPAPLELRFYQEYLVVCRMKHYYDTRLTRMEFDKFYYKDIRKCQYKTIAKRILIFGIVEGTWYKYEKDGKISEQPVYHKTVEGMTSFYTDMAPEIDFVSEIEAHSPIRVTIEKDM